MIFGINYLGIENVDTCGRIAMKRRNLRIGGFIIEEIFGLLRLTEIDCINNTRDNSFRGASAKDARENFKELRRGITMSVKNTSIRREILFNIYLSRY